jgi:hypothetical protein
VVVTEIRGGSAMRVFQSVASGLLGRESVRGGWASMMLGLGLHFFIAFSVAAVYFTASRRLGLLRQRPVLCGMPYGVAVYCFMHYVVIPLSAIVPRPPTLSGVLIGVIGHAFLVGIPAAVFARGPAVSDAASAARQAVSLACLALLLGGVFQGRDTHEGQPVRVRYTWSGAKTPTPRGEHAFSAGEGRPGRRTG